MALTALLSGCSLAEDPSSKEAFERWLEAETGRARVYLAFTERLRKAGVEDVIPPWQLLRVDADYVWRCDSEYFDFPPNDQWDAIIPTLHLLRDEVIPVVGKVEVASAYRSEAVNACVGGAKRSQHRRFTAVDLVPEGDIDKRDHFTRLCRMHARLGAQSHMGLGAYFEPDNPGRNSTGRFHIDSGGFRRWGYDYTSKSDPCPELLGE
ncbi:MAG: D-Ala-D-Ala carboxypeptidase family metallohydrolase [Pseudomonadota bacterium]